MTMSFGCSSDTDGIRIGAKGPVDAGGVEWVISDAGDQNYPEGWLVVDHVIPGVTPQMLDWWWVNMEKGYELWCPDEHKGFRWEVLPPAGGHIGAVQVATESIDYGPIMDLRIEWMDPNLGTPEHKNFWTYKHLLAAGSPGNTPDAPPWVMLSHQYEAIPGGTKMRSCMHVPPGMTMAGDSAGADGGTVPPHPSGKTPTGGGWRSHNVAEVGSFKDFLPALWQMWQSVSDPAINRQCSLEIEKQGSQINYVK